MRMPRPFPLILCGLALMGVLRTTTALIFPETDSDPGAFVSAANAAGSTEAPSMARPACAPPSTRIASSTSCSSALSTT